MTTAGAGEVRYAHHGDVRIAFEDLGGAGGEPLLLVMGLAVSRFWWPEALVAELVRRGFHVGSVLYRWLVTGKPVSREAATHIIDTVLDLAAAHP